MDKEKAFEYGCEVLLENTTMEKASGVDFPTDAYIIKYKIDEKECIDLTRTGKLSSLFDMYYDIHGKNVIKKIDFGSGNRDTKMRVMKTPQKKKIMKG